MKEPIVMHIDGDFPTECECGYLCSPTCHPLQIGPDWKYGCTHPAWPPGDFVPIVNCKGELNKCELPMALLRKRIGYIKAGITQRQRNHERRMTQRKELLNECEAALSWREKGHGYY